MRELLWAMGAGALVALLLRAWIASLLGRGVREVERDGRKFRRWPDGQWVQGAHHAETGVIDTWRACADPTHEIKVMNGDRVVARLKPLR